MDVDLEFHQYPTLFSPGSWPDFDRDVAVFNFWGNETSPKTKYTTQIGSAVAFFNRTDRARKVARAWAEAMAWEGNRQVPDDQVLDLLLTQGGWLKRASFGWLPTAYLRTMPSYYRGVVPVPAHQVVHSNRTRPRATILPTTTPPRPHAVQRASHHSLYTHLRTPTSVTLSQVIDHDHGSPPGLQKHSSLKPRYPPVASMELCDPQDPDSQGRNLTLPPAAAANEAAEISTGECPPRATGGCQHGEGGAPGAPGAPHGVGAAQAERPCAAVGAACCDAKEERRDAKYPANAGKPAKFCQGPSLLCDDGETCQASQWPRKQYVPWKASEQTTGNSP